MAHGNEWWRGCVIYQIYPRSFNDANGDGIGDLRGAAEKMGYIAKLGADAVWLSPFFTSPMKDFGYDISDYRGIDPMFGAMADFEYLVAEAHKHGLKVIIDQVLSHSSVEHPWFVESAKSRDNPKADWYVWADPKPDGSPPNNWLSLFGGVSWEWSTARRQYYLHNFLVSQADFNMHNPEVRRALLDVLRFWLDKGVDGFRLDVVNFYFQDKELRDNPPYRRELGTTTSSESNPYTYQDHIYDKNRPENPPFLEEMRRLMDEKPGRALLGEIHTENSGPVIADYTRDGKRLNMAYSFAFMNERFSAAHIRNVVETLTREASDGWICWAVSNHDVVRVVSRWGLADQAERTAPLLYALLLSLRGSVCVYEGEELGLTEADIPYELLQDPYGINLWPEYKGRDGCRTPIPWEKNAPNGGFTTGTPWLPVPPEHLARAVDAQEGDRRSILSRNRAFTAWRKTRPELVTGDIAFVDAPEPVLAFRRGGEHGVFVAFNLGPDAVRFDPALGLGKVLADSGFGGGLEDGRVALDGYDAIYCQY